MDVFAEPSIKELDYLLSTCAKSIFPDAYGFFTGG
jgi:hypothetical protein